MSDFGSALRPSCLVLYGSLALGACFAPSHSASAQHAPPPPTSRPLPDCANHLEESGALFLTGHCLSTSTASLIDGAWRSAGTAVGSLEAVQDGVVINNGVTTALLISLDGLSSYALEPGESIVVGSEATPGYTKGCVSKCGQGWIFISAATCGGSNCQCQQVTGPCIDPSNNQLVETGVPGCKPGWGR